jgi:hypothetical protein
MGIRGKKSAAELSTIVTLSVRLPQPPKGMTERQAKIWREVIATKPADWFAADSLPLLVCYCRACETADLLQDKIDAYDPAWLDENSGLARYEKLLKMRSLQVANITSLATKMRLSQQSRYRGEAASVADKRSAKTGRLWERANIS